MGLHTTGGGCGGLGKAGIPLQYPIFTEDITLRGIQSTCSLHGGPPSWVIRTSEWLNKASVLLAVVHNNCNLPV